MRTAVADAAADHARSRPLSRKDDTLPPDGVAHTSSAVDVDELRELVRLFPLSEVDGNGAIQLDDFSTMMRVVCTETSGTHLTPAEVARPAHARSLPHRPAAGSQRRSRSAAGEGTLSDGRRRHAWRPDFAGVAGCSATCPLAFRRRPLCDSLGTARATPSPARGGNRTVVEGGQRLRGTASATRRERRDRCAQLERAGSLLSPQPSLSRAHQRRPASTFRWRTSSRCA